MAKRKATKKPARKIMKKTTKRRTPRASRTTHRSRKGNKLYAVRDASGQFEDIQTYKRAHGQDIERDAIGEM